MSVMRLFMQCPKGLREILILAVVTSFHSNDDTMYDVDAPRCSGAICSNGVRPCMEISSSLMMHAVQMLCCGHTRSRTEKRKQSRMLCTVKMSRVDACFRKPCFVLKRPFWKGLWRNLRNLRNWSSLGGRCFHPPAYTKRSCLVWKVIRNVGSWARLHERGSVRAARHAMMYRIFPPQIFTQNSSGALTICEVLFGLVSGLALRNGDNDAQGGITRF